MSLGPRFFRLLTGYRGRHVFNPWTDHDPGTDAQADAPRRRRQRLARHLSARASVILVGEASGYQGCHVSGIPFTSERLLLEGVIPRIAIPGSRLSTRARPWSEPSATTVWGTLHELGVAKEVVLWNAFPWHPHRPGSLQSNRTPGPQERAAGLEVLRVLLSRFPDARVFAVGRHADASLSDLGVQHLYLRHPSMAGAAAFRQGLVSALRPQARAAGPAGARRSG